MSTKSSAQLREARRGQRRSLPMFWTIAIGLIVAFGVAIAVATASSGGGSAAKSGETRPVHVNGASLPSYTDQTPATDDAVGTSVPTLVGNDFNGKRVTITNDGKPKAIAFVAHWCPHCRAEVPRLASWLKDHQLPANLELYIVPTSTDPSAPNYPPSTWLRNAGLGSIPTLVDSSKSDALQAYGAGGFPYWVYVDAQGKVVARTSGEYPSNPDVYTQIYDAVANGQPFPTSVL
jgi:thiol-disulfide isomerase/thioredoxin